MIIPHNVWQEIIRQADAGYPEEVCGLLSGKAGLVTACYPVTNQLHSATRFSMAADEMITAMLSYEAAGDELLAIYHSHPGGKNSLSATDIRQDYYPGVLKIVLAGAVGCWQAAAWQVDAGSLPRRVEFVVSAETK